MDCPINLELCAHCSRHGVYINVNRLTTSNRISYVTNYKCWNHHKVWLVVIKVANNN